MRPGVQTSPPCRVILLATATQVCVESVQATATGANMNKDQVKGQVRQAQGQVKEAVGKISGDKTLETKGQVQNIAGKVQESYGNLKSDLNKKI